MRKLIIKICVAMSVLSLSGCTLFANDDWKKKFGTPELFLESAKQHPGYSDYLYLGDNNKEKGNDTNAEINQALLECAPFAESKNKKSSVDTYFTYENFLSNATSGPNYCLMCVYTDGFIRIDHKSSLGPHQYAYFSMDATKAEEIYDKVAFKIHYENKVEKEDLEKAQSDGAVANFIAEMEKQTSVRACYRDITETDYQIHTFVDTGEILSLIKDVEYTPNSDRKFPNTWVALEYHYKDSTKPDELEWSYNLHVDGDAMRINYEYIDTIGRRSNTAIYYSLDATKGLEIINRSAELAKAR